jgi:hypothetical protein
LIPEGILLLLRQFKPGQLRHLFNIHLHALIPYSYQALLHLLECQMTKFKCQIKSKAQISKFSRFEL